MAMQKSATDSEDAASFAPNDRLSMVDQTFDASVFLADDEDVERQYPRVVGAIPGIDAAKPKKKRIIPRLAKLAGGASALAVAFALGVAAAPSRVRLEEAEAPVAEDSATFQSSSFLTDGGVDASEDWPTSPDFSTSSFSSPGVYDVASETSSVGLRDEGLYSAFDSPSFGSNDDRESRDEILAGGNNSGVWSSVAPAPREALEIAAKSEPNETIVSTRADAPADGFAGFQGYEFLSEPSASADGAQPVQTALAERDALLTKSSRRTTIFNDQVEFNDSQSNLSADKNVAVADNNVFSRKSGYNSLRDETDGSSETSGLQDNPTLARETSEFSRFQGYGSLWSAPEEKSAVPSSESPFPEDRRVGGEYVAQNFDDADSAPSASRKPARTVRW